MGGQSNPGMGMGNVSPYAAMQGRVQPAMQAFQQARMQQMNALYPQMAIAQKGPSMLPPSPLPPVGAGMKPPMMYPSPLPPYSVGGGLLGGG